MIEPVLCNDTFLKDIGSVDRVIDTFQLWWLGQSGFLLHWNGRHLLMDPYLSDSLSKKYANSAMPHIRMTNLVVEPKCLDFIDIVTSSHIHTDHFDAETLRPILEINPELQLILPTAELATSATKLGQMWPHSHGLDDGESITVNGFRIHAIASAHETIERDQAGHCRFLGYVIEFGDFVLYHSGDTVFYPRLLERLSRFRIDVALLPINGRRTDLRVAGNMNAHEAARLGHDLRARLVIPCHYDMFSFNTAPVDEFIRQAKEIGQAHCVLRCGERWDSSRLLEAEEFS